jgi:hypothetical protein
LCDTCMRIERCPASLHQRSNCLQVFPICSPVFSSVLQMFSCVLQMFSKCSSMFSKCSSNVRQMFSNCFRYERTLMHTTAGVHVSRTRLQQENDARHSFNSNRGSIHIVSGIPLPIACSCSVAHRSGNCLAAHSGMQLILCLLCCSKS